MQISIQELKKKSIWIQWKYAKRDGKITKVPINAKTGDYARTNDPDSWNSYGVCIWNLKKNHCNGVGLNFAPIDDNYAIFGIDIDGHKSGNNKLASEILDLFKDTYAEYSPSGTGYHIIGLVEIAKIPDNYTDVFYQKNSDIEIECYLSGITKRYFTFTGDAVNVKKEIPISDVTDELLVFLCTYMRRKTILDARSDKKYSKLPVKPMKRKYKGYNYESPKTIDRMLDIARQARNGSKFSALYDSGDISDYNDDDSRADLALCCMLAFYFKGDLYKMDSAFRDSALYRPKWEREDYSKRTMLKAIEICGGEYFHRDDDF